MTLNELFARFDKLAAVRTTQSNTPLTFSPCWEKRSVLNVFLRNRPIQMLLLLHVIGHLVRVWSEQQGFLQVFQELAPGSVFTSREDSLSNRKAALHTHAATCLGAPHTLGPSAPPRSHALNTHSGGRHEMRSSHTPTHTRLGGGVEKAARQCVSAAGNRCLVAPDRRTTA